jgi:hypothetical protein
MTSHPLDTDAAAWAAQSDVLDRMGGPERLRVALELSEAIREVRLTGIRSRHPELTRRQAVARLVREEHGIQLPEPR